MKNMEKYINEYAEGEGLSHDVDGEHITDIKKYLEDLANSDETKERQAERKRILGIITKYIGA